MSFGLPPELQALVTFTCTLYPPISAKSIGILPFAGNRNRNNLPLQFTAEGVSSVISFPFISRDNELYKLVFTFQITVVVAVFDITVITVRKRRDRFPDPAVF